MIEREKVVTKVRETVEKNKLEKSFLPLIEEFFFRAADQYDWTDYDFDIALNIFKKVSTINFINIYDKLSPNTKATVFTNLDKHIILYVFFDISLLKGIFQFSEPIIDNFINAFMHELGHVVQSKFQYNYTKEFYDSFITGFHVRRLNEAKHNETLFSSGTIANEYAEVINATRLEKGYISSKSYFGYEDIQYAGKVILSSLGITEMEYSSLQLKGKSYYESFISNRLGKIPSKMYIDSFEELLDCIHNFASAMLKNSADVMFQRKNLLTQIYNLQTLSKMLFEERFDNINLASDAGLIELAKLIIDKKEKDNSIIMLFDQYNVKPQELQIKEDTDIYTKLSRLGYDDDFLLKLHNIEHDERIKIQEKIDKQNQKRYNNEGLREVIYQNLLRYPINDIPIKYRPSILLSKMIGKFKRRNLNKNTNLLTSGNTYKDKHSQFVSKIASSNGDNTEMDSKLQTISKQRGRKDSTHDFDR